MNRFAIELVDDSELRLLDGAGGLVESRRVESAEVEAFASEVEAA